MNCNLRRRAGQYIMHQESAATFPWRVATPAAPTPPVFTSLLYRGLGRYLRDRAALEAESVGLLGQHPLSPPGQAPAMIARPGSGKRDVAPEGQGVLHGCAASLGRMGRTVSSPSACHHMQVWLPGAPSLVPDLPRELGLQRLPSRRPHTVQSQLDVAQTWVEGCGPPFYVVSSRS